ncbi:ABC transporter substrate-binding protein [Candidatus Gracilibacteria bacterium]|nr:ABC transporter substrate-binding protein [Candidatus Gracilibacteria bacterium]
MKHPFLFVSGFLLICLTTFAYLWHQFFLEHSKLEPAEGGIFTEATIGKIQNLNPLSDNSSLFDKDLHQLLFAGLLRYNPLTKQIESGLAEFKVSDDPKTYELTIKDSAQFSDGKKVTIEDVLFTFEEIIQNTNFSNKNLQDAFEYVALNVIDEKTISFTLPEQNSFFPALLTTPILPKIYFKNNLIEEITDPDLPFNKKPIGAGAFRLKNIVPNNDGSLRVFLERNPYFYAKPPLLEQLVFYVYPSLDNLKINHNWPTVFSQFPFSQIKSFKKNLFGEYQSLEFELPRFAGIFFNLDQEVVNNPFFRKALFYGFGGENFLENDWKRIDSPFFFEEIETNYHVTNFIEARKLLRDNGFPYNKEQEIRTFGKNGKAISIKFITSTNPPIYSRMSQNIARIWEEELDIEVDLEILEPKEFQKVLHARKYDLVLFGQNFSENFDTLSLWHSSQSGKLNLSNLTRDDTDFLIDDIRFSGAQSDWFTLSEKLDEILPSIIFATPQYSLLISKKLFGFEQTFGKIRKDAHRFFGIEKWHFHKEKKWNIPENKSKFIEFFRWIF